MSMPVHILACSSCSAQWQNRILWALFSYDLSDGRLAHMEREAMWCNACNSYCPVEQFPEMKELEENLAKEQQKLEQVWAKQPKDQIILGFIRRPGKVDKKLIKSYENAVVKAQARIEWKMLRQSPRKCLLCGSQDILDQGDGFESPIIHPGCGGTVNWVDAGIRIADRCVHRIYDIDGHFLREECCQF